MTSSRSTDKPEHDVPGPLARPPALHRISRWIDKEVASTIEELKLLETIADDPATLTCFQEYIDIAIGSESANPEHITTFIEAYREYLKNQNVTVIDYTSVLYAAYAVFWLAEALRLWKRGQLYEAAVVFGDSRYEAGRAAASSEFFSRYGDRLDFVKTRNRIVSADQRRRVKKGRWQGGAYLEQKRAAKIIYDQWKAKKRTFTSLQKWAVCVLAEVPSIQNIKTVLDWERYEWRATPLPRPKSKLAKKSHG